MTSISVSGDTVHYSLYPPSRHADKSSVTVLGACINEFAASLLPSSFLWHRDSWILRVVPDEDDLDTAFLLEGYTRIGDSIDDEWALVWILREISRKWPELCISVYDQDGSFLLIEAAEHLPKWVTPANSDNRVWIADGGLHLVPLEHKSSISTRRKRRVFPGQEDHSWLESNNDPAEAVEDEWISVHDAIDAVRRIDTDTRAPSLVEVNALAKLARYPNALKDHCHLTKAYLPPDIAKALSVRPDLVQQAAEAFYTRDANQLRSAHRMARFSPTELQLVPVRMTRLAYAQILGQKFFPPKSFRRWDGKGGREGTVEWKRRDIGVKIAVGFEMRFQDTKNQSHGLVQTPGESEAFSDARLESLRRTPQFQEYIERLTNSTDYFRGSIRDSKLWLELERKAATTFINITKDLSLTTSDNFASIVTDALSLASIDALFTSDEPEDSDDWINVSSQDLESILRGDVDAMEVDSSITNIDVHRARMEKIEAEKEANRMQDFARRVGAFVEGEGELNGAIMENEQDSDDEDERQLSDFSDPSDSDDEPEEQDQAARQLAMDKLVEPLAEGEYGKMPASFYETSQPVSAPAPTPGFEDLPSKKPSTAQTKTAMESLRRPFFARDAFDGVDSDDESSVASEDFGIDPLSRVDDDDDTDEDRPQVEENDELEVDMAAEEEEFLEFSRAALGIDGDMWDRIIEERTQRGAYVPGSAKASKKTQTAGHTAASSSNATPVPAFSRPPPAATTLSGRNPKLDSFDAVMQAMDAELSRIKGTAAPTKKNKGKNKQSIPEGNEDEEGDVEAEMDDELRQILEKGEDLDGMELGSDSSINYNLIKNFLESYSAQGGESGPVGGLAGMLGSGFGLR